MKFFESETIELKATYVEDVKKEVIAFANSTGGTLYIGVEDDGTVCGIEQPDSVIQQISNAVRDSIKPDVTMFVHYSVQSENQKNIIEVNIQCGTHKPYYLAVKGLRPEGVFVRQGTSTVPASDLMIRQMIKETDGDNYEDMRSLNQNLTFEKATKEFQRREIPFEEPQMRTLGIMDSNGLYSNLALLLSDQCPHIIKAATFNGIDGMKFHDRVEFTGSLLQQLEDAYAYLDLRNNTEATFEGFLRIDHKSYPDTAIRESLLNAIVHRDYSISAATLLSTYDNRIEMISVGGLAGISYDDMMLGISYCRNKKLADIFYRLQLIESYGTGMGKIMSSYNGCPTKPQVQVSSGAFKITLPNMNSVSKDPAVKAVHVSVNEKEQVLLDLFKEKKRLTRSEVEKAIGVSTSTARRFILNLVDAGHVKVVGKGKNAIYEYVK